MMQSCFLGLFPSPRLSSRGYDIAPVYVNVCCYDVFSLQGTGTARKLINIKMLKDENKTKHNIMNVKR